MGVAYLSIGQYKQAIPYFDGLLEINPNDVDILSKLGTIYYSLGKHSDAIPYFEKIIAIVPDAPYPYSLLGVAYYSIGEYAKGKENLLAAKKLYTKQGNEEKANEITRLIDELI